MRDHRPALALLLCQGLVLLALLGYWLGQPATVRAARLWRLWAVERVATLPPPDLVAQARWLGRHRLQRLRSLAPLVVIAVVIGGVEGSERLR